MKFVISIVFILFFTFLNAGDWTLFFYMAADNGLHSYAIDDILEMQKGLYNSQADVQIIVYIDHIPSHNDGRVEILKILPSESNYIVSQVLKSSSDENSGDPETLLRFINWAYPRYSSPNNALILWSHSSGWIGKSPEFKWICSDNTSQSAISISNGGLREALERHNKKYDVLILDVCNAGSLEVITEIYKYADYIIASPKEMPATGFPWMQILANWDSSLNQNEISAYLINNFIDAYDFGSVYNPMGHNMYSFTASSVDTSKLEDFFDMLTLFSNFYADEMQYDNVSIARNQSPNYNDLSADIDLRWFFTRLKELESSDLLTEILNQVDELISYDKSLNSFHDGSISIFFPEYYQLFETLFYNHWSKLQLSQTSWSRFLNYSYGKDTYPPLQVSNVNSYILLNTIYLEWDIPLDPCPLSFKAELYSLNGNLLKTFVTGQNSSSFKIDDSGFIMLYTVDEAGNQSEAIRHDYEYKSPSGNHFYITPNPITGLEFNIRYYLDTFTEKVKIDFYNISGQLVWEGEYRNQNPGEYMIKFDLEKHNLSSGIYFGLIHTDVNNIKYKFSIIR